MGMPTEQSTLVEWCDWLINNAQTIDWGTWEAFIAAVDRTKRSVAPAAGPDPGAVRDDALIAAARRIVAEFNNPKLPESVRDDDVYYQISGLLLGDLEQVLAALGEPS